jgi:hypothetical protein
MSRVPLALFFAATFFAGALQAATTTGSGTLGSEQRRVSGFTAVALRGPIDVTLRQGESESVQVRADDNLLPLVQTLVEGDGDRRTLRIQLKPGESVRTTHRIEVQVDLVRLDAVSAAGSGDIAVMALKTPALALSIAGSSDARVEGLDAARFAVDIAGSGNVRVRGRATRFDVSIAGSGNVQASGLEADDVSVSIAGSGDASVTAQKTLAVSVAGTGDVDYGGTAVLTRRQISGLGSIRQRR